MFAPLKPTRIPNQQGLPEFGFRVGFVVKDWFFDTDNVKKHLRNVERGVLRRFGAYTRRVAINSMKDVPPEMKEQKGYHSAPYTPPHAHSKNGIKRGKFNIVYGYDPARRSVVIGPRKMPNRSDYVPYRLEYGGSARNVINPRRKERKIGDRGAIRYEDGNQPLSENHRSKRRVKAAGDGRYYIAHFIPIRTEAQLQRVNRVEDFLFGPGKYSQINIQPHPYMRPAFWKAKAMLPSFWQRERSKGTVYFSGTN